MLSYFSCVWVCDSIDCSPPGSSVCGIFQAWMLEWVSMPFYRGSSWPRDWICISCDSCFTGGFLTIEPLGKSREKPCAATKTQHSQEKKKKIFGMFTYRHCVTDEISRYIREWIRLSFQNNIVFSKRKLRTWNYFCSWYLALGWNVSCTV